MKQKPRQWQTEFLEAFFTSIKRQDTFLCVGTPGCGKTDAALLCAKRLMDEGVIDRIVVVVPSDNLRTQWQKKAINHGIQLNPIWNSSDGPETADFQGIVVTYQSLTGQAEYVHRRLCATHRTLLIVDEIHHAGEDLQWGEGLINGFTNAVIKLNLSGTPFRHDNIRIPFITYADYNGTLVSKADYTYSLARAIREKVCRYPYFPSYEGTFKWSGAEGIVNCSSFADELSERVAAERLTVALAPEQRWLRDVIVDANNKITECRRTDFGAAGLVIAKDQNHAERVARLVEEITGEAPVVVTSKTGTPADIEAFRSSNRRWLVSIKMVSEGTDIPRFRALVFATNIGTERYFQQALGRVIRLTGNNDDQCYMYMPAVPALLEYARRIQEIRDHVIELEESIDYEPSDGPTSPKPNQPLKIFSASAVAHDVMVPDGVITAQSLRAAEKYQAQYSGHLPPMPLEQFTQIYETLTRHPPETISSDVADEKEPVVLNMAEEIKKVRGSNQTLASQVDLVRGWDHGESNRQWRASGGKSPERSTFTQLKEKEQWLINLLSQKTPPPTTAG